MKNLRLLLILGIIVMSFASCKKQFPPGECKPSKIPCPAGPQGVGAAIYPEGIQVGSYVFDIDIYYTNPVENSGQLIFYIGGKQYASQTPLTFADIQNLGDVHFTIALAVDTFTLTTVGYNTPQRCDCDPTVYQTHFGTPVIGQNIDADKISTAIFRNKWY